VSRFAEGRTGEGGLLFFDSHCHLTDERFAGSVDAAVAAAGEAGVTQMVTIASDVEDARAAIAIANRHAAVWCSVGIHPHVAASAPADAAARLRELARDPRVRAIGETGLDYHYDNSPSDVQRALFEAQIGIAAELSRPVIVHCREADEDTASVLRAAPASVRGVLHCFSSGAALLEEAVSLGWYVSFAGMISFRNYDGADLVRRVPREQLLVETDSPYLAPVPMRGRRNEPAYVVHVAAALAALREESLAEVAAYTTANARSFYRIED
jgi:TatD DNase family protein